MSIADRFNAKWVGEPNTGCWLWTAALGRGGYGVLGKDGHRPAGSHNVRAHRLAWELYRGPIPEGYHVHHRCEQPSCVNPDHLAVVSPREHALLTDSVASRCKAKSSCDNGHLFDRSNTRYDKHGHRRCRACDAARWRKRQGMAA